MILKILHLNIERDNHIDAVINLLKRKKPDIACFEEAKYKDVEKIAEEFKYYFAFSPRVVINDNNVIGEEGSVIFSKYPIQETKIERYDDKVFKDVPVHTLEEIRTKDGKRPVDRFFDYYALLSISIKSDDNKKITISTTHFPVVDHIIPGLEEHHLGGVENLREIEHARLYLKRLVHLIRKLPDPVIFTSDLNNTRGEFFYDKVAQELVDIVPNDVVSTLDPKLHRKSELKLVVDTIMTSHQVSVENFEIIEGVSDHKALFALLKI